MIALKSGMPIRSAEGFVGSKKLCGKQTVEIRITPWKVDS